MQPSAFTPRRYAGADRRRTNAPEGNHPLRRETDWPVVNPAFGQSIVASWRQIYTTNSLDFARLVANGCLEASAAELTAANRRAFIGVCVMDTVQQANQIASMMLSINTLGEHVPDKCEPWTVEVGLDTTRGWDVGTFTSMRFRIRDDLNPFDYRWLFLDILPDCCWDPATGVFKVPLLA